jgi:ubiquinone/menaquinone biosynthesis C-methylase UbiE
MQYVAQTKRMVDSNTALRAWYDDYFAQNGTWPADIQYTSRVFRLVAQSFGRPLNLLKCLDVACGGAHFLAYAQPRVAQAFGCDLSASALRESRRRLNQGELLQANGQALPYADGYFDLVTCLGSLEHFLDVSAGVSEMARVLNGSGRVLILAPVEDFWLKGDVQPTETVYSSEGWEALFAACGLRTISRRFTAQDDVLRPISPGCGVFFLRKA